jgi:hypothetical protein
VHRHLESPTLILEAYTHLGALPLPRSDDLVTQEVRGLTRQLTDTDREEHRLLDAYQTGLIALDQLERRQRLLRQKRAHLQASLEGIRQEHAMAVQRAELQTSLQTFTRSIRGPLATLPFETRQRLIRLVVQGVMVEEGQVDIHFAIPVPAPLHPSGSDHHPRQERMSTDFRLRSHDRGRRGELSPARRRTHPQDAARQGKFVITVGRSKWRQVSNDEDRSACHEELICLRFCHLW